MVVFRMAHRVVTGTPRCKARDVPMCPVGGATALCMARVDPAVPRPPTPFPLQTFATMLQLAPFPLSHLEAAITPGPQPAHNSPPAEPGGDAPAIVYDPATIVDERYGASAVLLRDVHASLLRLAENHGPKAAVAHVQPEVAKLVADDSKAENWQERTINAVLAAPADISTLEARVGGIHACMQWNTEAQLSATGAHRQIVFSCHSHSIVRRGHCTSPRLLAALATTYTQEAAWELRTVEYLHLKPRQRLAMLRVLMELALASEVLRDHINARIEALAVPIKARVTTGPNGMLIEEATGGPGRRSAIQPLAVGPADAENPEFWTKWLSSCK